MIPEGHGFPARMPLPTTLLGRLAGDQSFRGRGLGGALLVHALKIAVEVSSTIASAVIEVDAKDEVSRSFYAKYGFRTLPDDPLHMYLPMATAQVLGLTDVPLARRPTPQDVDDEGQTPREQPSS